MGNKFLEDIVEEDLREKRTLSKTIGSRIREKLDSFPGRHPVFTSSLLYVCLELIRRRHPHLIPDQAPLAASYCNYLIASTTKEYLLEGRKLRPPERTLYSWFLHNPKLVALLGAITGSLIAYQAESSIIDEIYRVTTNRLPVELRVRIFERTLSGGLIGGVVSEALSKGLNNIRRIKKSIRKIKTNIAERVWNYIFEHPLALSAAATLATFSITYTNPYNRVYPTRTAYGRAVVLRGNFFHDLMEHPAKMAQLGLEASLVGAIVLGSSLIAGSVLHTHSIRELYYRTAKAVTYVCGYQQAGVYYQQKLVSLPNNSEKTIEDIVELGNMHYEAGDKENAFRYYRRALRLFNKKADQLSYADFFRRTVNFDRIRRVFRRKKFDEDEKGSINRMFIDLLNKDPDALDGIKKLVDSNPDDPRVNYLYGKALEVLGYKESARRQKEKAITKIISSGLHLEVLTGNKNRVALFEDEMLREELIVKSATEESLNAEVATTERLRYILRDFDNYDVPIPIAIIKRGNKFYYVMEQASGELLADKIRNRTATPEEFYAVADFMGLIHARLNSYQRKEREYTEIIKERLTQAQVPELVVRRIQRSLYVTLPPLQKVEKICNKDAHPRNWMVDEFGGIVALDLEVDRLIPLTFDTANLLDQYEGLSDGEKYVILTRHVESFREYSAEPADINMDDYKLAYLNSVLIRALEIYGQLKTTKREVVSASLNNAQRAIDRIQMDFELYYTRNRRQYQELYSAIEQLKSI